MKNFTQKFIGFLSLLFTMSFTVNAQEIGDEYEGGYIFKINVDGTALVVDSENLGYMSLSDVIEAADNSTAHGHDDWYLPSNREMILITSTGVADLQVEGADQWYWTGSVYSSTSYGYRVNSGNSSLTTGGATNSYHVRAIRKVTLFTLPESNSTTIGDYRDGGYIFQVNEDGTGLIADFQDLENDRFLETMTWAENIEAAENSTAQGFDDWYAPSVNEMILMYNTIGPGGSNVADLKADWYWSTELHTNPAYGWRVSYSNASTTNGGFTDVFRSRAIRSVTLFEQTVFYGCTDESAFNYDANATDNDGTCVSEPEVGMLYEGGYIFKINVDGTALVVDSENILGGEGYLQEPMNLSDAIEAADNSTAHGHDDWYLPSNRDMILITSTGVVDLEVYGAAAWYWTRSAYSNASYGYRVNSGNSSLTHGGATDSYHVRAIRKVTLFNLPESNSTTIGDYRDGGYIFQVNEDGTGLIADFQDLENASYLEQMTWAENIEAAENSTSQGFDDWYAPSVNEMILMYNTIGPGGSNVADLKADWYWSSEVHTNPAYGWRLSYSNASTTHGGFTDVNRSRAIRSVTLFEQTVFYGCTDESAFNYDANATDDDGTCLSEPEVGMLYEGGYIFKINVDGTALVVDSENILGGEGYLQEPMNLSDAIEAADNSTAHGHDDWYLPSNRDMILITSTGVVDLEVYGSAAWYWTRSAYSNASYGYRVNSDNSSLTHGGATDSYHVRAIRKVTLFNLPESNSTSIGDYRDGGYIFQVNENGTGLIADFQDLENASYLEQMTWAENIESAENSTAQGFDDWYAPSVEQMQVIYNTIGPGGSNVADLKADWYWSSEVHTNPSYGWRLSYSNASTTHGGFTGVYRSRAIRNVVLFGEVVFGCTDETAFNYNSSSNMDDGSCIPVVMGCMEADAFNYNADANTDDGNCIAVVTGCLDETASNFNPDANTENNSCVSWEELANDLQGQLNNIVPEDGVSQADLDAAQSEADNLANNLAIAESDFSEAMDYILNLELDLVSAVEALVTAEANAAEALVTAATALANAEAAADADAAAAANELAAAQSEADNLANNLAIAESDFSEAMDYILNLELDLVSAVDALVTAEANAANASAELAVAMGNQEDGIGQDDVDAAYDAGVASVDVPEILTENISVALPQGWSLIGYTCVESINVMEGFVSISEKIDIVKDEWGLAYLPEWGFSAFDNLDFGEGYQIKMIEEVTDFQFCPTITGTN